MVGGSASAMRGRALQLTICVHSAFTDVRIHDWRNRLGQCTPAHESWALTSGAGLSRTTWSLRGRCGSLTMIPTRKHAQLKMLSMRVSKVMAVLIQEAHGGDEDVATWLGV